MANNIFITICKEILLTKNSSYELKMELLIAPFLIEVISFFIFIPWSIAATLWNKI